MYLSAALAFFAVAIVRAQPTPQWVEEEITEYPEDIEKRYTPELVEELQLAKADALLLYTEFTARAAVEMKSFLKNISGLANDTFDEEDWTKVERAPADCQKKFKERLSKIEYDAQRSASFSAENHHKFFLGHMIVFRMHLNKSEEFVKKCERVVKSCGYKCETTPQMTRWRRLAANEINRVLDDIQHSRRSYRDLLTHAHRRLNTLRKQARTKTKDALATLQSCAKD